MNLFQIFVLIQQFTVKCKCFRIAGNLIADNYPPRLIAVVLFLYKFMKIPADHFWISIYVTKAKCISIYKRF